MKFIEILKAFLIGIVQGITEWLPVSSTGHMILFNSFLKLDVSEAFWDMFLVVIQLGSILAVLVLFWQRLNPFSVKKTKQEKKQILSLWFHVILAIIPSGIVGVLLDDWFDAHLHRAIPVAIALIVYGVIFLFLERLPKRRGDEITSADAVSFRTAFLIGLFQILSSPAPRAPARPFSEPCCWDFPAPPPPNFPSSWPSPPCWVPAASRFSNS